MSHIDSQWSKRTSKEFRENWEFDDMWIHLTAKSICIEIRDGKRHPAMQFMNELSNKIRWPNVLNSYEYSIGKKYRPFLKNAVGLGLGIFDLVIIDEAHKSRNTESGLSRLLKNVVLASSSGRRFAMTATPVELDIRQWKDTLSRIGLDDHSLTSVKQTIETYSDTVKRVRQCPSSQDARDAYKQSAVTFQKALSPYLLRRDKREDSAVQLHAKHSHLPIQEYRCETEISIETGSLSHPWKQAVCASEALSVVTHRSDNGIAKRLRLTIGNGHGISTLLDQIKRDKDQDKQQEESDEPQPNNNLSGRNADTDSNPKRYARAKWWLGIVAQAFSNGNDSLFDHPAILASVKAIEELTGQGEKVLVFGRFTLPLLALVDLLNAREMLHDDRQARR